jgi:hypothetical protein
MCGCWCLIATLVIAFVMPTEFYADGYVHVARVVSAFLLIIQVAILIDCKCYVHVDDINSPSKE